MRSIKNHGAKGRGDQVVVRVTAGGPSSPHDVGYATFVEEGTSKMGPQPFMRPAMNKHAPQIVDELADMLELLAAGRPGRISGSIRRG
jgi:HK97 gp10 family phage protein